MCCFAVVGVHFSLILVAKLLILAFLFSIARNLDLYQVLAPNAYSYKEEFIPVIRKTVQSQVHEVNIVQILLTCYIKAGMSAGFCWNLH